MKRIRTRWGKRGVVVAAAAACCAAFAGCGDDGAGPAAPEGGGGEPAALSGGDLTVFTPTLQAYSTPAPVVSDLGLHLAGDVLAETGRVAGVGRLYGGLGPTFNATACASCHSSDGRTTPDLWRFGGSGPGESNFLVRIGTVAGEPVPGYGTVIQDQAIFGASVEAKIEAFYTMDGGAFDDGEPYELARPSYFFDEWYTGSPPADLAWSVRIPLRQVGLGLLRAVDDATIEEIAAAQVEPVSGRPNETVDQYGNAGIGRFGHKAQNVDLDVERTFLSDIGVTSDGFADEPYGEQDPDVADSVLHHPPDIGAADLDAVDFYFHTLGVPARRDVGEAEVMRGERIFGEIGCASCHLPEIRTGPATVTTLGGTPVPELSDQLIRPYTDLLLHDMGPDLADGLRQGSAGGAEWRTTPLWGIGLQEVINGHTFFLHDGRARSLMEAILWHGGEAKESREGVLGLNAGERAALIRFVESL